MNSHSKSTEEMKERLRKISENYYQIVESLNDSATEIDDARSTLSGYTLLGVQETKGKGCDVVLESEEEDLEPVGCFFRMFIKQLYKKKNNASTNSLGSRISSSSIRIMPSRIQAAIKSRQEDKTNKLWSRVHAACASDDTIGLEKLLANKRTAESVKQKPDVVLGEAVRRSPELVKVLIKV